MRILHVLTQRPGLTGSGVTIDAIVSRGRARGHSQHVVVGVPAQTDRQAAGDYRVGGLTVDALSPIWFNTDALPFPVPGMSDLMPYESSVFSQLSERNISLYKEAWRAHLGPLISRFRPNLINFHHLWIGASVAKELAPKIPLVIHSHGTGLRQLDLAPHLAAEVIEGCGRADAAFALHPNHREDIVRRHTIERSRVHVVGAGYRDDVFSSPLERSSTKRVAYAGKLSSAKGVDQLLSAFEGLDATLVLCGGGSGEEADSIRTRARSMSNVELAGRLSQEELADFFRTTDAFVLPSFYEGLPLVLVEAAACGCRLVATDLPGVRQLHRALSDRLEIVPAPGLEGPDTPVAADVPAFVDALREAITTALKAGPKGPLPANVAKQLSWDAVYDKIENVWVDLVGANETRGVVG